MQGLEEQFGTFLHSLEEKKIVKWFDLVLWFAKRYASAYELEGTIYLVLDNSLIQDFKHRRKDANRALRAMSYLAFCRFVRDWSDRPSHLAISPMAIYEHLGRQMPESADEVLDAVVDLHNMLRCSGLKIAHVGFETHEDLFARMRDIVYDEENLTDLVAEIDKSNWSVDLSAPIGVKIPLSVAWDALPQELALRYFDDWYVRFVLAARIEHYIVQQCEDGAAKQMSGGVLGKTLADLNTFSRNGLLKGLGDIDLLQICDINRQYKEATGYVLVGQTLDRDLAIVLSERHTYHVQAGVVIGEPQQKERIKEMVSLMFSRPFSAEEERGRHIHKQLRDFADALVAVCKHALTKKS